MDSREGFVRLHVSEFDLRRTLESGQIFHAMPEGDGWQVLVDRTPLYVEQQGAMLGVPAAQEKLARRYFALDHPLGKVYAEFPSILSAERPRRLRELAYRPPRNGSVL
jgi:hypothetical protein